MFRSIRTRDAMLRTARCVYMLIIMLVVVSGCGKELPVFESLDLQQWRKDKNACGTYRTESLASFQSQKEKLLALKELQVVELLGRPDRNELYKRSQKFYYYYLKPAPKCAHYDANNSTRLAIRFNAMGLAKEIAIE